VRRPNFERWLRRQILGLADTDSFNLRKLAALAQKEKPRLAEPLLLYAYTTGKTERLLSFVWNDELYRSYLTALEAIENTDLAGVALSGRKVGSLSREYSKFLDSYRAAYNKPESNNESKRLRWERSRALQLEKGVNTSEIYQALALNAGNVNAYMKHGALEKVSLKNATDIMKYLYTR